MEKRKLGNTNISVSTLGYGAGHIGSPDMEENFVGSLLNQILDSGINLIDTAKGYGLSEERIGKHLSYRRKDFVLSTKVGYGVSNIEDWTYDCIIKGVEQALNVMKTDYIDIVHLHSCSKSILEKGDVILALEKIKKDGKVLAIAYSGENEALEYAINTDRFDSVECSVNVCDQHSINNYFSSIINKNTGVISKRPIANAPWRFDTQPYKHYCENYWKRMKKMNLENINQELTELFLRFSAYTYGVTSIIVGSTNINHIKENINFINKGVLDKKIYNLLRERFNINNKNWIGEI